MPAKKFSMVLFEKYDVPLRAKVLAKYPNYKDNHDIYGIDLVPLDKYIGSLPFVELQVATVWKDKLPTELVIYERKKKWAIKGNEFWVFNDNMTEYFIVKGEQVVTEYLRPLPWREEEYGYFIPTNICSHNIY